MSADATALPWALVLIVAIPLIVVALGEVAERLRQRGSEYLPVVRIVRSWVLPLATALLLSRLLLASDGSSAPDRILATALVLTAAVASYLALRLVITGVKRRAAQQQRTAPPQLLLALPRVLLLLVLAWLLLGVVWGLELSRAVAALGVGSLVVSLALQQPLGSLASGLLMLADQPFRTGDWIEVGSDEGVVIDVNWRTTRLRTRGGDLVVFPNSRLVDATVVNYSQPTALHRISIRLKLAFSVPPAEVVEVLVSAAKDTPGVLAEPAPDVVLLEVGDPEMAYEIRAWIDDRSKMPRVRSALTVSVWYWCQRTGLPMPNPAQDVLLWDGPSVVAARRLPVDELRARIADSPLLGALPGADLDLLAASTTPQLFAPAETIVEIDGPDSGVVGAGARGGRGDDAADDAVRIIHSGRAALIATTGDGVEHVVTELGPGEVMASMRGDRIEGVRRRLVAVTACELLVVDAGTAETIVGRTPILADSLDRVARSWHRRIERLLVADEGPAS